MSTSTNGYLMEDAREAQRLAAKVDAPAWVERTLGSFLAESEGVLDVGCGPGAIAKAVAQRAPHCRIVGLDASAQRLETARATAALSNVSFQQGDACELPFGDDGFDLAYCRFLLEYLPRPGDAIGEMARVVRPGGRVILQDLDGQLLWHYPVDLELQAGLERVLQVLARTGFDPFVGRKLHHLAWRAGLRDRRITVEPYHLYAGPIDEKNAALWATKFAIARPAIAEALGGEAEADRLIERFRAYLRREETLTYSVAFTVTGTVA
jgi:SAM-dependent methyltransferase